ncbi:MAG: heavy-metal-associated domain-containing protein [Ruthenibacterium lactatiformans]
MVKQKYNVTGMTCSACSAHVEKAVRGVQGVSEVSVNLLTNSMVVESDAPLEQDVIVKAVEHAGYGASPADGRGAGPAAKQGGRARAEPHAGAAEKHAHAPVGLVCLPGAADVCFHGQHGRPSAAGLFDRA